MINWKKIFTTVIQVLIGAAIIYAVIFSGKFYNMKQGSSWLFVLIGTAAMTLLGFSAPEIMSAFKDAFKLKTENTDLQKSAYFWQSATRNSWMMGCMGSIIAFIVGLGESSGGINGIAYRMASALMPTVYGMFLAIIFFVPAIKLSSKHSQSNNQDSDKTAGFKFEYIAGYILLITLLGWSITQPLNTQAEAGPLNPWEVFLYWPALLIVGGVSIILVLFVNGNLSGHTFTLSFALTGLLGTLMGFVQVPLSMVHGQIEAVAANITFSLSCAFFAMLGMMLVGIPLEDRLYKTGQAKNQLRLSRMAWYIFPLVTFIILVITFIIVITPVQKRLIP